MDQLVFILIVAVVAVVKWALKQQREGGASTPPPPRPRQIQPPPFRPVAGPESEEERMRKFLDALGIPAETAPPAPPQQQRPAPVQQPPRTAPPMPRRAVAQTLPRRATPPPVPIVEGPQIKRAPVAPEKEAEPVFETISSKISAAIELPTLPEHLVGALESQLPQLPQPAPATAISPAPQSQAGASFDWLRSPADIRRAIVLREILGQPRALQPYAGGPL